MGDRVRAACRIDENLFARRLEIDFVIATQIRMKCQLAQRVGLRRLGARRIGARDQCAAEADGMGLVERRFGIQPAAGHAFGDQAPGILELDHRVARPGFADVAQPMVIELRSEFGKPGRRVEFGKIFMKQVRRDN